MSSRIDTTRVMTPEEVVNIASYPIVDPNSPERAELVAYYKEKLDRDQYVSFPDFITPDALRLSVEQVLMVAHLANHNSLRRNCFLNQVTDPSLPDDHPQNMLEDTSNHIIAYDQLPENSPLKILYHWDATRQFVADVVGEETLYDNEDPYQPVNAIYCRDGDQSTWHFDSVNAFTMTLMLQAPYKGGEFQFIPNLRTDEFDNPEGIRDVLLGDESKAINVAREPGALCIFRGCNSLHRVKKVEGDRLRIMGVFVYETEPGVVGRPEVNETIFGPRVATQ